jgi:hypothetical protein
LNSQIEHQTSTPLSKFLYRCQFFTRPYGIKIEAPDGVFGSREIGGKTGWEQGDWAKKSGRFGSKTGAGAGRLGKYAVAPIWEQGDWVKKVGDSDPPPIGDLKNVS